MTARFRSKRASSLPHNSGPVPAKLAWGWPFFFDGAFEPASTEFPKRARGAAALRAPLPRPSPERVRGGPEGGVPQRVGEVPHATVSRHRSPKESRPMNATEIAAALSTRAEDVCRRYLPRGRKQGRYWTSRRHKRRQGALALRAPGAPRHTRKMDRRRDRRAWRSARSHPSAHRWSIATARHGGGPRIPLIAAIRSGKCRRSHLWL